MTTAKKATTKPEDTSPLEDEATEKTARTFTVMIAGEEVALEDRWERESMPASIAMMSRPQYAEKYLVPLIEQLIGEGQIFTLFDLGADVEELGAVVAGWVEARGAKN